MPAPSIQQIYEQALQHHQAGRLSDAERLYRQILSQQPDHSDALQHLGVIAHQSGHDDIAVELIRRAIALKPDFAAYYNLGIALYDLGEFDDAIAAYTNAIALKPDHAGSHSNLAASLIDKGRIDDAIPAARRAISLNPTNADAHAIFGNALQEKGDMDGGLAAYKQALALNPNHAVTLNNLGILLRRKCQSDDAIAVLTRAVSIAPKLTAAFNNLGIALKDIGQVDQALIVFRKGSEIQPPSPLIDSNIIFTLHFQSKVDAATIAAELRRLDQRHAQPLRKFIQPHSNDRTPDRRLRIGYVSPDFRQHVVARNLLPLLEHHDRRKFEIFAYAQLMQPDAMTDRIKQNCDTWRTITGVSDEKAAQMIRADKIDILVDLALHTSDNRLLVFARKPAPIQVSYLAYCGSSGLSTMDYRFSDPYLDPPDTDLSCYSETTIRLPKTYWCYQPSNEPTPEPSVAPSTQHGFITFGCQNNFAKVSPDAIDLWIRILLAVPNSRIIIHSPHGSHRASLIDQFEQAGISKDRVTLIAQQSWTQYMETYSQIDIALDPFPQSGGVTTCDALWMGVPVVTLCGSIAVGRNASSILTNVGLPQLIARTPDEYAQIAINLALDTPTRAPGRFALRGMMQQSPLMNPQAFAQNIESAYRQMWKVWIAR